MVNTLTKILGRARIGSALMLAVLAAGCSSTYHKDVDGVNAEYKVFVCPVTGRTYSLSLEYPDGQTEFICAGGDTLVGNVSTDYIQDTKLGGKGIKYTSAGAFETEDNSCGKETKKLSLPQTSVDSVLKEATNTFNHFRHLVTNK